MNFPGLQRGSLAAVSALCAAMVASSVSAQTASPTTGATPPSPPPGLTLIGTEQELVMRDPGGQGIFNTWHVYRHAGTGLTVRIVARHATRPCTYTEYNHTTRTTRSAQLSQAVCHRGVSNDGARSGEGDTPNGRVSWSVSYAQPHISANDAGLAIPPRHLECLSRQMNDFQNYFDQFTPERKAAVRTRVFSVISTDNSRNSISDSDFQSEILHRGNLIPERAHPQVSGQAVGGSSARAYNFTIGISSTGVCDVARPAQFERVFSNQGEEHADLSETLRLLERIRNSLSGNPDFDGAALFDDDREMYAMGAGESQSAPMNGIDEESLKNPHSELPPPEFRRHRTDAEMGV